MIYSSVGKRQRSPIGLPTLANFLVMVLEIV